MPHRPGNPTTVVRAELWGTELGKAVNHEPAPDDEVQAQDRQEDGNMGHDGNDSPTEQRPADREPSKGQARQLQASNDPVIPHPLETPTTWEAGKVRSHASVHWMKCLTLTDPLSFRWRVGATATEAKDRMQRWRRIEMKVPDPLCSMACLTGRTRVIRRDVSRRISVSGAVRTEEENWQVSSELQANPHRPHDGGTHRRCEKAEDQQWKTVYVTATRQDLDMGPLIRREKVVGSPSAGRVCGNKG